MSPAKRASETRVKRPQSSALAGGDPLGGLGPLGDNGSSGPHNGETGPLNEADVEESGTGIHFQVEVSEPLKVGDVLTAYVTYKVKTKTNSPLYRNLEFSVNRRFRDFLWLYQQLVPKYPGVIIPPVPEKHAIGRFEQDFIESRRVALERFAQKVAAHPVLQNDTDLRIFLESETFLVDVNQRKKEESKGFMRAFSNALTTTTSYAKLPEFDEAFDKRKAQIETLDSQLKGLMKALEGLIRQRRELGGATMEFGDTILSLANGEANKPLAHNLTVLGSIQKKLKELHEKQARHDINHLATVVDEYIRVIGSIRIAFNSRAQAYGSWQATEANLQKKRDALEKLKTASRTRSDKIAAMSAEIEEAETQVSAAKKEFENVSTLLQKELDRCDREKVADFTAAMRAFLRSLLESQKEVIGLWESYFADTQSVRPQQSL
ncbi:Vacuolar protein sorting-associated protein 5 [Borealophlyctis nickersoniae]|nr:Vacuolar protein sorting-associated protein 5 [Borealophlyctis nickersoniae]